MRRVGVEPLFVCEIINTENQSTFFSTAEYTPEASPFSGNAILPLVVDFGRYSSVAKTDGFGSLESLDVTFNDFFGMFKEMFETKSVRDYRCKLYIVVKQPPLKPEIKVLLDGRLTDPMEWDETTRNVKIGLISNVIFDEFGFQPDYPEHDYLQKNLTGEPWPHVFGAAAAYKFDPICTNPTATLAKGIVIQSPGEDGNYWPYTDTDAYNIFHEGEPFVNIYGNDLGKFPATAEGEGYYQMRVPGGNVLFKALNVGGALNMASSDDWNIPYFCNMSCWSPQQFNGILPYQQDSANYLPNTTTLTGFGHLNQVNTFNIHGELSSWPGVADEPFPYIGFNPDQEPWLLNQYIYFTAFRLCTQVNDVRQVEYIQLWAKVIGQNGLNLVLDEITDEEGLELSLSGYRPCFIHFSIGNKVFIPSANSAMCGGGTTTYAGFSQGRWPEPPVKVQRGKQSRGGYIARPDESGIFDRIYHIEAGTEIKPVNWWPTMVFPVSLDLITTPSALYIQVGYRLLQLNQSQYSVVRYNKQAGLDDGFEAAWTSVTPGLNAPPYIPPTLYGMDYHYMPDECTFAILRPSVFLMMARDLASTDVATLRVLCGNDLNTDEKVFKFTIEKYTTLTAVENPDVYYHHPVGFMIQKKESVPAIISRLAWEHAKLVRIIVNQASLVDTLQPINTAIPVFNEGNIENGALRISYTPEEEIRNYIEATAMDGWQGGRMIVKDDASILRLTRIKENVEIGFNRIFTTPTTAPPDPLNNSHWPETDGEIITIPPAEEGDPPTFEITKHLGRGYNRVLYYWLHDYSNHWMMLSFNTFLDAVVLGRVLVSADIVRVNLASALNFIQPEVGIPLNVTPIYGSGSLPQANGLITEISIDPKEWTVSMAVKLPIAIGTNTPQYVVEE